MICKFLIFVAPPVLKCHHNIKAYISYPVPNAHKSKTYMIQKFILLTTTVNNKRVDFRIKSLYII